MARSISKGPFVDAHLQGRNQEHVLHKFYEWLDTEPFLEFARTVTGFDEVAAIAANGGGDDELLGAGGTDADGQFQSSPGIGLDRPLRMELGRQVREQPPAVDPQQGGEQEQAHGEELRNHKDPDLRSTQTNPLYQSLHAWP